MACCNTTLIIKQTSFEVASKHWVTGHFRKNIIIYYIDSVLAPPLQALACLRTFQRISLLLGRGVVESWSRGVWTQNTSGVVHCRRNAREASRGASSRGTPAPCLQALGIKVDGQVPCSHLSLHILAHLGTHFAPLPSPLHWTLHCIVYFQSVLNASVIHPTQSLKHILSHRDMSKHVEAPLHWGCPEVLHKLLHLRWQLSDSSCSCFLMFLSCSVTSWSCWKASWQPDVHV